MQKLLRVKQDPEFFMRDPYFLDIKNPYPRQIEIFKRFYNEDWRELLLIAGMRSGKTMLASCFAARELFDLLILPDPAIHYGLAKGSKIFVNCLAPSTTQGIDTIFGEITNRIENSPFFQEFAPKIRQEDIEFPKHIACRCIPSTAPTAVGRTSKANVFDEASKFEDTVGKRGAWNVYNSVSRAVKTLKPFGHQVMIGSTLHENDLMMQLFKRKPDGMWCLKIPTWDFNPNITRDDLKDEFQKDYVSAMRDYGCEPFSAIAPYYSNPDIIYVDSSLPNWLEILHEKDDVKVRGGQSYVLTCDPSVRGDAFGMGLFHKDEYNCIITDGLFRFVPSKGAEIDPHEVKKLLEKVVLKFRPTYSVWDYPMYPELMQYLREMGVLQLDHVANKDDYDLVKDRFYYRTMKIPDYPKVTEELKQLQVINARKVDHMRHGSSDVACCLSQAAWALDKEIPDSKPAAHNIVTAF